MDKKVIILRRVIFNRGQIRMHRLFTSAYLRTLQKLNTTELTSATAQELLTKVGVTTSGEDLLFKLPRDELKHALNIPCPINSLTEEGADAVIASSKLLRHHVGYVESKMCLKCPLAGECKSAKLPWDGQNKDSTMKDLLVFFNGMTKLAKPEQIYYRQWVAAYKLQESLVAALEDLVKRPEEIKEYDQLRIQANVDFQKKLSEIAVQKAAKLQTREKLHAEREVANHQQKDIKESAASKIKPLRNNQKIEEVMGRDFSFDEEAEFEMPPKATKPSFKEREQRQPPLNKEKGYMKIEKSENTYPPKSYPPRQDNFKNERKDKYERNDKFERNGYQDTNRNFKPKQDNFPRKFKNEEEDEQEFTQRQNFAKKERNQSFKKDYNNKGNDRNYQDAPRRDFEKKSQDNWKRKDNFGQDEKPKGNQFVNKWQDERQGEDTKPKYRPPQREAEVRDPSFSKPLPKQVHIPTPAPEPVDEAPKVGRNIRRRRTTSASSTPTEE